MGGGRLGGGPQVGTLQASFPPVHHCKLRPREGRYLALGFPAGVERALGTGSSLFRKDPERVRDAGAWESQADQLKAGKLVERGSASEGEAGARERR